MRTAKIALVTAALVAGLPVCDSFTVGGRMPMAAGLSKASQVHHAGGRVLVGGARSSAAPSRLGLRMQEMGVKPEEPSALRRFGLFAVWAAFGAFVVTTAGSGDAKVQEEMLKGLVSFPPSGPVSPVFVSIFAMLGVWPLVMAALLAPLRPKGQTLPLLPFAAASMGLGMGGITPYLALTSYDDKAELQPLEGLEAGVSSKGAGIFLALSTLGALLYALGIFEPNTLNGGSDFTFDVIFGYNLDRLAKQFAEYPLVKIPSVDFVMLWLLSSKPLYEDMKRRGWLADGSDIALFLAFMAMPLVGATGWLAIRPPIPAPKPPPKGGPL